MAIAILSVGGLGASGVASGSVDTATVSERQTTGCGAGVVEVSWRNADEVSLAIYENNTSNAKSDIGSPVQPGEHSFTTDRHPLTWGFVDAEGLPVTLDSESHCVSYH